MEKYTVIQQDKNMLRGLGSGFWLSHSPAAWSSQAATLNSLPCSSSTFTIGILISVLLKPPSRCQNKQTKDALNVKSNIYLDERKSFYKMIWGPLASGQDRGSETRIILPPKKTKTPDKIYGKIVSRHVLELMQNSWKKRAKQIEWALQFCQLTVWIDFPDCSAGRGIPGRVWWSLWVEEIDLEVGRGQRNYNFQGRVSQHQNGMHSWNPG